MSVGEKFVDAPQSATDWTPILRFGAAALLVFALDLLVPITNFSVFYALVFATYLASGRRRFVWQPALLMAALVFVGYFIKPSTYLPDGLARLSDVHLLNRGFVASVLLGIAVLARRLHGFGDPDRAYPDGRAEQGLASPDDLLFEPVRRSLLTMLAVVLAVAILAIDLATNPSINVSILLPLPLAVAVLSRNRRLVAVMIPFAAFLPFLKCLDEWSRSADLTQPVILNRTLTAFAALAFLFLLHRFGNRYRPA